MCPRDRGRMIRTLCAGTKKCRRDRNTRRGNIREEGEAKLKAYDELYKKLGLNGEENDLYLLAIQGH